MYYVQNISNLEGEGSMLIVDISTNRQEKIKNEGTFSKERVIVVSYMNNVRINVKCCQYCWSLDSVHWTAGC